MSGPIVIQFLIRQTSDLTDVSIEDSVKSGVPVVYNIDGENFVSVQNTLPNNKQPYPRSTWIQNKKEEKDNFCVHLLT